ncbi:hypothetical protein ACQEU8_02915 [Streptomyces sp. CA-250714]|uniref:hypothetical protein n=1 Tax=Streptomyces sp. CA-250714 TaxID=3240060 RepID=UPI003D8CECAF
MNSAQPQPQPETCPRPTSPEPEREVREVPVEFAAFCALYRHRYLEYAHSRLADARQADTAVRLAFAELADQWDQALRSPHTNAYAWRILNRHVRTHARAAEEERDGQEDDAEGRTGHHDSSFLPDHADDARILHRDLGMPLLEASEMMGHTTPRPR